MARMATGVARQDFSPISNINYDTLAQFKQAGLERVYQSDAAKQDRFRQGLKEAEQNRMLQAQTTGAIGGLLKSNPDLIKQAPETVQKAYKSYERGGGSLESNALLANFLTTRDTQQKQAEALQFQQNQDRLTKLTALQNAEARRISQLVEQEKLAREGSNLVTQEQLNAIQANSAVDFKPAGKNAKGEPLFEVSKVQQGKIYTQEQVQDARNKGIDVKGQVLPDGKILVTDINTFSPETDPLKGLNVAQKEAMTVMGKSAAEWVFDSESNPRVQALSNLSVYEDLLAGLESGAIETGKPSDKILNFFKIGGLDDSLRSLFKPESQNALELVRGVIFQGLRKTLGAQFTQVEGERLVNASYNNSLTAEQNIYRLRKLATVLKATIQHKDLMAKRLLEGQGGREIVAGTFITPYQFYQASVDAMENDFREQDKMLGVTNNYGLPSNQTATSDNVKITIGK
jgi:hypothetical protein